MLMPVLAVAAAAMVVGLPESAVAATTWRLKLRTLKMTRGAYVALHIGPAVLLVAALGPWPYRYYTLLRFVICISAAWLAVMAYRQRVGLGVVSRRSSCHAGGITECLAIVKCVLAGGVFALTLTGAVLAGPFEDAYAYYHPPTASAENYETALRLFEPTAERGDAHARVMLGVVKERLAWLEQLPNEAVRPYEDGLAAYGKGDYKTAHRLWRPLGLPPSHEQAWAAWRSSDFVTAYSMYHLLAEQGDAHAQEGLGMMYYHGLGVPQDYALAHMWFNLSVSANWPYTTADVLLRVVTRQMTPDQIAEAQRLARGWRPKVEQ